MGCATSKQKERLCRKCQGPCSPPMQRRSYSGHRHHPLPYDDDCRHLVSLTSSSLDSLRVDDVEDEISYKKGVGFSVSLIEAKTWSKMIDERIPKIVAGTPIRTPPGEPETINVWELMEGLEDFSPLHPVNHLRSFSFDLRRNLIRKETGELFSKPMWLELADRETDSKSLEFDPSIISTFREALAKQENSDAILPNENISETQEKRGDFENGGEFVVKEEILQTDENIGNFESSGKIEGKISAEMAVIEENWKRGEMVKNRVVLYFTSLRGVRKTYEDCCNVRLILKSIGVRIDERDVSMHLGFKEELKALLGDKFSTSPLPRVFFGESLVGGADEIREMHEEGRLEGMLLESGEVVEDGSIGGGVCEACGDVRFVPCERCSGSCKIYYGDENGYEFDDENEANGFDESGCGFQRCPDCNENGLVRCPICCD